MMQRGTRKHYFEQGYALIIGISQYSKVSKLSEVPLKDALNLHNALRDPKICGYRDSQVHPPLLEGNATAKGIRDGLVWLAKNALQNTTVFIYFSGHGWKIEEEGQDHYYLLAHDSDPEDLKASAIASDELTTLLNNIHAQRLLFCIDSCYAGGIGEIKGVTPVAKAQALDKHYYEQLAQGTGRAIIASSRSDEESIAFRSENHSLFTGYLLEALQGKASLPGDQLIYISSVFSYISRHTKKYNQHPIVQGKFEDFPIALAPAESPASTGKVTYQIYSANGEIDTQTLHEAMFGRFNRHELASLCANIQGDLAHDGIQLPVGLEDIGPEGPVSNQILNLIEFLKRREYLPYLVKAVRRVRPSLL
jgi:hypothetical protein